MSVLEINLPKDRKTVYGEILMRMRPDYSVAYLYDEDTANRITAHGRVILSKMLKSMASVKKEVRYLSVDDVLSGSGAKVISAPTTGIKTPSGKVEIGIEYPNGVKKLQTWGKYTVVGVNVPEVAANTEPIVKPTERSLESGL